MNAKDVMTPKVVTVSSGAPVDEVARLLFERRISALPVIDGGRLVGIISEADLLHRYEIGTDRALHEDAWWIRLFSADRSPEEYLKAHSRYARDIMSRGVATVAPDTPLAEIASLLEMRRIKRVPVLEDGEVVGIVSRSDLVRALASVKQAGAEPGSISDEAIHSALLAELGRQAWWRSRRSNVTVEDGVVTFGGVVEREKERAAARAAAETVPGVRAVVDRRMIYVDLPSMV